MIIKLKNISIILCFVFWFSFLTGCRQFQNEHKYLYEQMSAIDLEITGYEIINARSSSTDYIRPKDSEDILNNKPIIIKYIGDGKFEIKCEETQITIDDDFMKEKSVAYNKMNQIWDKEKGAEIDIMAVFCFDERLFIVTDGLSVPLGASASVKGKIPIALFCYNVENDSLLYGGFYSGERDKYGYYSGFLSDYYIIIRKL